MKHIIKALFRNLGFQIQKVHSNTTNVEQPDKDEMLDGLKRVKNAGINPKTILDGGAAQGIWSEKSLKVWNRSKHVLIEPLEEREVDLKRMQAKYPGQIEYILAALGKEKGSAQFSVYEDFDGSGININESEHVVGKRDVNLAAIDDIVTDLHLEGPFLLKLDTHGFELPIFEGAQMTLKDTALIVVEVYGFKISNESLFYWEICRYLDSLGFRLFDMVDILRREVDQAFWQCDMFFLKSNNRVFDSACYK